MPNNFISKILISKHFIKHGFGIMTHVPIKVHINTTIFSKEFTEEEGGFVEPLEVRIKSTSPCITVGFLFYDIRLFGKRYFAIGNVFAVFWGIGNGGSKGEICPSVKGWVNVNEVYFSYQFGQ